MTENTMTNPNDLTYLGQNEFTRLKLGDKVLYSYEDDSATVIGFAKTTNGTWVAVLEDNGIVMVRNLGYIDTLNRSLAKFKLGQHVLRKNGLRDRNCVVRALATLNGYHYYVIEVTPEIDIPKYLALYKENDLVGA